MKKRFFIRFLILLFAGSSAAILLHSCTSSKEAVDYKDLSYLYNPTKSLINPSYNVINESDDKSLLSVRFSINDLFFSEANPQGVSTARIIMNMKLYNMKGARTLADTAMLNLNIFKEKGKRAYIYEIPLKVEPGTDYLIEIKILDRLRLAVTQDFIQFNTTSVINRYNFKVLGHFDKTEIFSPVLRTDEFVNLVYTRGNLDSLFISYYKPFREVPDPPSMLLPEKTLDYDPLQVAAIHYSDTLPMMFPKEGVYLCSTDRHIKDGFTFLNLGPSFPRVTTPEVMIEPLAYIASQDEISGMESADKPKVALDEFWIKCGGNVEKARELIRIYYTRVLYSNFYFTSYKEGWRSERGMIYIMYGPPDKVYKSTEGERWGYKKPPLKSKWANKFQKTEEAYLFFSFKKRENVFSDNDFYLNRSETLVTYWDKAVSSWRKGIVFRLDNPKEF
jgi:GWxTD domain-containing protein